MKWLVHLLSVKLEEQSKYISLNMELTEHVSYAFILTLLHSERPKLYTILVFLSAVG